MSDVVTFYSESSDIFFQVGVQGNVHLDSKEKGGMTTLNAS
jgi:hypothetical protein